MILDCVLILVWADGRFWLWADLIWIVGGYFGFGLVSPGGLVDILDLILGWFDLFVVYVLCCLAIGSGLLM